jgi:two-component system invasion response regulator UvrY
MLDLVLLDISLPDRNGIEVLKQARSEIPDLPILMLSMHREDQYALRAIRAGAAGYLNKQSAPDELITAMRTVAAGRKYISPTLAQALADHIDQGSLQTVHSALSDREFQTLVMIASGKTVSQIASELSLSVKTISMYRSRLLQKMRMQNNAQLTHYALSHQLVPDMN